MKSSKLTQSIEELRERYVEDQERQSFITTVTCSAKVKRLKKKIAQLETERCHKLMEQENLNEIDAKIASERDKLAVLRSRL